MYNTETVEDYIYRLIDERESSDVEFKSGKGGFPKEFWPTYSAFANTNGGTIVLGVVERKDSFSLAGLSLQEIEHLQKELWRQANNRQVISSCILAPQDVRTIELEGSWVLLCYVPRAQREQRPIYCQQNPEEGTYRRGFEGDFHCTPAEVRRMLSDSNISHPADSRILQGYKWEDIDQASFDQYRRLFHLVSPGHVWLTKEDLELMKKLGGYRRDRESGEEGFTVAGLLMFGKYEAIIDPLCAPHYFPDYKEFSLATKGERWLDRICPDGTWEANLFQFYRRVLPKLQETLPLPFHLEGNQRKDQTEANVALREAFANLCIHADYSEESTLQVNRYPHCIVFSNPGTMLISQRQYYAGGESVCRNKSLQQMFMLIGAAEKAGSGADKIMRGWESIGWKMPFPNEKFRPNKVELTMPLEALMEKRIIQELEQRFGEERIALLNQDERTILSMALTEGVINNNRLQSRLTLHTADITKTLQKLTKGEFLISEGRSRGTVYRMNSVTDAYNATSDAYNATSDAYNATSDAYNATSDAYNATSDAYNATSGAQTKNFPKRFTKDQCKAILLEYCKEWRSIQDIADHLKRSKSHVRNVILPQFASFLERKHTFDNHPDQQYKTKS